MASVRDKMVDTSTRIRRFATNTWSVLMALGTCSIVPLHSTTAQK
ncbi:unnamed protein product [Notodromas monacha]|uniref:Uncharacterized protein n=1 Tax=Notodromas monacha TaxID=399045 RepID=A0A7R9GK46_9CRUS|nr:unnamed protein product [Notodromas monacha]CAG0925634.1 unnamed protein product [Notodromas monacha]